MRGAGDLLLATGIVFLTGGLIGSLEGPVHRIVSVGTACVVVGVVVRTHPRDGPRG